MATLTPTRPSDSYLQAPGPHETRAQRKARYVRFKLERACERIEAEKGHPATPAMRTLTFMYHLNQWLSDFNELGL